MFDKRRHKKWFFCHSVLSENFWPWSPMLFSSTQQNGFLIGREIFSAFNRKGVRLWRDAFSVFTDSFFSGHFCLYWNSVHYWPNDMEIIFCDVFCQTHFNLGHESIFDGIFIWRIKSKALLEIKATRTCHVTKSSAQKEQIILPNSMQHNCQMRRIAIKVLHVVTHLYLLSKKNPIEIKLNSLALWLVVLR